MASGQGSTALITGGGSGLGLATAAELLQRGTCSRVVLVDRDGEALRRAKQELQGKCGSGVSVEHVAGDVCSEEDMQRAVDLASGRPEEPLRVVVNSAGVGYAGRVVGKSKETSLPVASFAKVLEINTVGTFIVTKLSAEAMSRLSCPVSDGNGQTHRGVVINVASVAAFDGQIGQVPYSASKGAIVGMTLPLAREFARHHIRVMTIAPGVMSTPMMLAASDKVRESLIADIPFPHRLGAPEEFSALVRHIVENTYLNGDTIRLDGALRMPPQARL